MKADAVRGDCCRYIALAKITYTLSNRNLGVGVYRAIVPRIADARGTSVSL
jgi:hypothetical protein